MMMRHHILVFLGLFTCAVWPAHGQSDCAQQLIQAERAYYTGRFNDVQTLLEACIASGFEKDQKTEAYKLIALSSIFSKRFDQADSALRLMMQNDPLYTYAAVDPPEFKQRVERIKVIPRLSMNLMAGGAVPMLDVTEVYSLRNSPSDVTYNTHPGYQFGLGAYYSFTKHIFVEAGYEWQYFSFELNKKSNLVESRMDESQQRTQLTLGLGYAFQVKRVNIQVVGGLGFNSLNAATTNYYYLLQLENGISYREKLNFSNLENRAANDTRPFVMLRVGLPQRTSVGLSFFARYELGTANYSTGRLDNLMDVFQYEKVEDDFKVSFISFGVVASKLFFKVK